MTLPFSPNDVNILTWKLPGVEEAPKGLLEADGESNPELLPPGGDGVLMEELRGIRKFGRFLVKF